MSFQKFASIVLDVSIDKTLDYGIPNDYLHTVQKGMRVEVPLRGRKEFGYIFAIKDTAEVAKVQPINRLVSDGPLITDDLFELGLWMARYYAAPIRQVFRSILPSSVRKEMKAKEQLFVMRAKTREEMRTLCETLRNTHSSQALVLDEMLLVQKGILLTELLERTGGSRSPVDTLAKQGVLKVDIVRIDRSPLVAEDYFKTDHKLLNGEQKLALDKIVQSLNANQFATHLLYGITGSGKTEVYLQAIDHALQQKKGVIMLVPEISLTPQTIQRFRSRFEGHIAILHHRLSHGERFDEWHKIKRGDAPIVIGARSALFSPVPNLGLIIVDEEHEQTYKQSDDAPHYHARDVAVMRSSMANASVILGSATPSIESFHNTTTGKYLMSRLDERADKATRAKVSIVDMKIECDKRKGLTLFSDALLDGIVKRKESGEQSILFLNRRGYHTTLLCKGCSSSIDCPHCDLALTYHRDGNKLSCHLCSHTVMPPPKECPKCGSSDTMKFRGAGTEQVERQLLAIIPDIRTIRMDADTTKHKGSHQKLLRAFATGKADVLIGTQMIAKGLHFPEVTLVGIISADTTLNIPDFRASENTFQLITQVAGRSGRGVTAGEVIIQTFMPDNPVIKMAAEQDYDGFYASEVALREMFSYPPFTHIGKITFSGIDEAAVKHYCEEKRKLVLPELPEGYQVYPVTPSGHPKVKDKYRYQFLILGKSAMRISRAATSIRQKLPAAIKEQIDIDPSSTYF